MLVGLKARVTLFLIGGLLGTARAQTPAPPPTHVVRSISAADTDFQDLEFLTREIGPARVVMLGEPRRGQCVRGENPTGEFSSASHELFQLQYTNTPKGVTLSYQFLTETAAGLANTRATQRGRNTEPSTKYR